MQPPEDVETIAKQIRTFEPEAEVSKNVKQVSEKSTSQAAPETQGLNSKIVTAIVQGQQALIQSQQTTQEL